LIQSIFSESIYKNNREDQNRTITDLYFNTFTAAMEKHGFIKKNKIFIRKTGEDIIQAISIRGRTTPFYFLRSLLGVR